MGRTTLHRTGILVWVLVAAARTACTLDVVTPIQEPPEIWDPAQNTHPDSTALRQLLDGYVREGLPGVVLYVRTPRGRWNGASGYAKLESADPMRPAHRLHAASVTKMYTAVAALLLAEDGLMDLDAGIREYLPDEVWRRIPNGDVATVRQLLSHTSGIPDFSGALAYDLDFLNDPFGSYPVDRLLGYLDGQSSLSEPGAHYFYSNANYLLLALAMDHVAPGGHAGVITQRILRPLGLDATYYRNEPGYPTPPGLVNCYQDVGGDGRLMNVSDMLNHSATIFFGNAGLIATSADYAAFIDGLMDGRLISQESLSEMQAWREGGHYGLGLSRLDTSYGPAVGHDGGDMGVRSQVRHFPDVDATLVLLSNGGDGGVPDTLFRRLWDEAVDVALGGL